MPEPEWITIAEAAKRLGLAERQTRRWADKLPADGRRQEETTPGRSRALIRLDLLTNLVSGQVSGHLTGQVTGQPEPEAEDAAEPTAVHPATEGRLGEPSFAVPLHLAMTAQRDALERVISEQAARICDLQAALEHERGQAKQLTEALAREQTLRVLSAPGPEMDGERPESPQTAQDTQNTPDPPETAILNRIRAFWQKHWY